jgi:hypothetical protein
MPRHSERLIVFLHLLLSLFSTSVLAEDKLELSCNVIFDHYAGNESVAINKDIVLTNYNHKPEIMVSVAEKSGYEFLAMINSVQQINNQSVINNFQVVIKSKIHNLSMSALSDSVYTPGKLPQHARIDLADYHDGRQMEKGSLLFECRHFE